MTEEKCYIFNLETTKIELHFEKSDYQALTDKQKRDLKSAFLWSRKGNCWVSRAKEPNLWNAKKTAASLGFTKEQREGERLSFAEQVERASERAEARADRYERYADNAENRAEHLQKPINDMHSDIAFFTQPNINTSSGRAFTRRREKMFSQYEKGFEEYRKSEYFKSKAETARLTASNSKYKDKAYLDRRIKECQQEIRKRKKNITYYEKLLDALENGEEKKRYSGEPITTDDVKTWLDNELELTETAMDKQAYLENCLDELGGINFSKENIKVGYIVRVQLWGKVKVKSTGPVNFVFEILDSGAAGGILKGTYAEIVEIINSEEYKQESHPFTVGERFNITFYDSESSSFVKRVLEIVKATDSSIKLKMLYEDGSPTQCKDIIRKPKIGYGGKWQFSFDDSYGNTFYKEVVL